MSESLREWAEDHGYRHYRCCVCGWSGWTDGDPRYECNCAPPDKDAESEEEGDGG